MNVATTNPPVTASSAASVIGSVRMIPFHQLVRSPLNVRTIRPDKASDKRLIDSIRRNGLLQNLVVYPVENTDTFAVSAGGRRFGALAHLVKADELPGDMPVPCVVTTDADAVNVSLVENVDRAAMHPLDRFRAFDTLAKRGASTVEIASRHGVTEQTVHRSLRLTSVHATILKAFGRDELSFDSVTAYALTTDRKRQLAVYTSLGTNQQAWRIRGLLTEETIADDAPVARYVGVDAYEAAGGPVERDLFNDKTYLRDKALLFSLAEAKIEKTVKRQRGWKWVTVELERDHRTSYSRIASKPVDVPDELIAELDAIETRLETFDEGHDDDTVETASEKQARDDRWEALEKEHQRLQQRIEQDHTAYDPDEVALAGCIVSIDRNGRVEVDRGLVRAEDMRALKKQKTAERSGTDEGSSGDTSGTPGKAAVSQALGRTLGHRRRAAIRIALAQAPDVAQLALHYSVCVSVFGQYQRGVLSLTAPRTLDRDIGDSDARHTAPDAFQTLMDEQDLQWLALQGAERFDAFAALPVKTVATLVAIATASMLDEGDTVPSDWAIDAIGQRLDIAVRAHWTPDADNYFGRLKTADLMALGEQWFGAGFTKRFAKAKKSELVAYFDDVFTGSGEGLSEQEMLMRNTWVPEQIVTTG